MPIIAECPSCQRKLRVPDQLVGRKVKCPACKTVFAAKERGTPSEKAPRTDSPERVPSEPNESSALVLSSEWEIPREPRRPRQKREEEIVASLRDTSSEGNHGDQDRVRPHRGTLVLSLGLGSLGTGILALPTEFGIGVFMLCCGCCMPLGMLGGMLGIVLGGVLFAISLGCGIPAMVMARADLHKIEVGVMDSQGRARTNAGWICALIGIVVASISLIVTVVLVILYGVTIFSIAATPPARPGQNNPLAPPPPGPGRKFSAEPGALKLWHYLPTPGIGTAPANPARVK